MDETKQTVSVEEAARILGISRGLAYQMVREHQVEVLHFGRRIVIPKKVLERLLEQPDALVAGK